MIPTESEVSISDDGETVRLLFRDDFRDAVEILIPRKRIHLLLQQLAEKESGHGSQAGSQYVPISGQTYETVGFSGRPTPEGGAVLTVHARTSEQGGVTIPLTFSPTDIERLIPMLIRPAGSPEPRSH